MENSRDNRNTTGGEQAQDTHLIQLHWLVATTVLMVTYKWGTSAVNRVPHVQGVYHHHCEAFVAVV